MAKKAPKIFAGPFTEIQFEKKILKYIEQRGDREFLKSSYENRDGKLALKEGLDQGAVKRLQVLAKAIKANRRLGVRILPLAVTALAAGGLVFFFAVFLNPFLERALERGLEAIFEARVDATNFRLSLLRFRVGLDSLIIADRDQPMQNLIQMDRIELRLKPQAVLRGKIYIEEIRTDNILFGTARTVSGALPGVTPREKAPKPPAPALPPLVDLANFDPQALLNREFDKLAAPKAYDAAVAAYQASLAKWQNQAASIKERGAELRASAQPFLNFNTGSIRDPQAAVKTIADITAMVNSVQAAVDDVNTIVSAVGEDIQTARSLEETARSAVSADFAHLRSYLDLGSGTAMEALEPSIRGILTNTAEEYLTYGVRALEILEKVKAMSASLPKQTAGKPKAERFRGRNVIYPTPAYPQFYLNLLATDFTLPGWHWDFDLRGVSSNPDISDRPTELALSIQETTSAPREFGFQGRADFRTAAAERFNAGFTGTGFPLNLEKELGQTGIGGFRGSAGFSLDFSGLSGGSFSGGGSVAITDPALINPQGTLAQAVDEAIRQTEAVALALEYAHDVSGPDRFSVTTNIGQLIMDALKRTAQRYLQKATGELEKALREKISAYIDERFLSKEELDLLLQAVKGDKTALDQIKNTLTQKQRELETKFKAAAQEAVEQAKDDAKQQAEQAAKDLLEGKTPSFQAPGNPLQNLPKLPSF